MAFLRTGFFKPVRTWNPPACDLHRPDLLGKLRNRRRLACFSGVYGPNDPRCSLRGTDRHWDSPRMSKHVPWSTPYCYWNECECTCKRSRSKASIPVGSCWIKRSESWNALGGYVPLPWRLTWPNQPCSPTSLSSGIH